MKGSGKEDPSALRFTAVRVHWLEGSTESKRRNAQLVWLLTEDLHRCQEKAQERRCILDLCIRGTTVACRRHTAMARWQ